MNIETALLVICPAAPAVVVCFRWLRICYRAKTNVLDFVWEREN